MVGEFFPQQRELMGSSAQIGSGVCRCRWQVQVSGGSGSFRRVLESSAKFWKVPVQGQVQVAGRGSARFRPTGAAAHRRKSNLSHSPAAQQRSGAKQFKDTHCT